MTRSLVRRVLAAISAYSMRVVGAVSIVLATGVTAVSLLTDRGLAVTGNEPTASGETATTIAAGAPAVDPLITFTLAHPAYPVAIIFGFVLLALGDNVPLLGS